MSENPEIYTALVKRNVPPLKVEKNHIRFINTAKSQKQKMFSFTLGMSPVNMRWTFISVKEISRF